MKNMEIYNQVWQTPKDVTKEITAGRLKGFTDINPMWRIKKLTEIFGPCGVGWYTETVNTQIVDGGTKAYKDGLISTEKVLLMDILLYVKTEEGWSKGISGKGGATLVANENYSPFTDDDCTKKAETDALSNACKKLGFSADIYMGEDNGKYQTDDFAEDLFKKTITKEEAKKIVSVSKAKWGHEAAERCSEILKKYGANDSLSLLQIYLPNVLKEIENA
ncbi:MAG: hypothetical protein E7365_06140 [Clostridiales bacterium]|nr:hypothetical protein [Clostridiales bacterium]